MIGEQGRFRLRLRRWAEAGHSPPWTRESSVGKAKHTKHLSAGRRQPKLPLPAGSQGPRTRLDLLHTAARPCRHRARRERVLHIASYHYPAWRTNALCQQRRPRLMLLSLRLNPAPAACTPRARPAWRDPAELAAPTAPESRPSPGPVRRSTVCPTCPSRGRSACATASSTRPWRTSASAQNLSRNQNGRALSDSTSRGWHTRGALAADLCVCRLRCRGNRPGSRTQEGLKRRKRHASPPLRRWRVRRKQ
jgi:hypothetical protein